MRKVEDEGPALKAVPDTDADQKAAKEAALLQWQSTMERLQNTPPVGRLVIHISKDPKRWRNTSADIQVRAGDTIYIPKVPTSVMVEGDVYNPTAVAYKPGKSAGWYLQPSRRPEQYGLQEGNIRDSRRRFRCRRFRGDVQRRSAERRTPARRHGCGSGKSLQR